LYENLEGECKNVKRHLSNRGGFRRLENIQPNY